MLLKLAIFVGTSVLIAWGLIQLKRRKGRKLMDTLRGRGARVAHGPEALPVQPSSMIAGGKKPPVWSAELDRFGVYQLKQGHIVTCWRPVESVTGQVILYTPPDMGDWGHNLTKVITDAGDALIAYVDNVENSIIGRSKIASEFLTVCNGMPSCCFIFDGEGAFFVRYDGSLPTVDEILESARSLDNALSAPPSSMV